MFFRTLFDQMDLELFRLSEFRDKMRKVLEPQSVRCICEERFFYFERAADAFWAHQCPSLPRSWEVSQTPFVEFLSKQFPEYQEWVGNTLEWVWSPPELAFEELEELDDFDELSRSGEGKRGDKETLGQKEKEKEKQNLTQEREQVEPLPRVALGILLFVLGYWFGSGTTQSERLREVCLAYVEEIFETFEPKRTTPKTFPGI